MKKSEKSEEKSFRILKIIKRLYQKEIINRNDLANEFNVDVKTIQRDIDTLRNYFLDENNSEIKYSRSKKGYYLENNDENNFTNEEIIAVSKVILESRAFNKKEINQILKKLVAQSSVNDRKVIREIIKNEEFNYIPLQHNKDLLTIIWNLSQYIYNKEMIDVSYTTKNMENKKYVLKPLSIMFSEYYFYLIAYIENKEVYPVILRIDRISEIKEKHKKYSLTYKDTFKDGEFRKYVHFMHAGTLTKIRFKYTGYIEYVLDKFPTAKIVNQENDEYTIEIETYGNYGAEMWLRSQGNFVKSYEII